MSTGLVRVRIEHHGVVLVLVISGDLDTITAAKFAEHASGAADGQVERLVLDLAGLRFIDCCGARALAAVTRTVGDDCPVIVRAVRHRVVVEVTAGAGSHVAPAGRPGLGDDALPGV